MQKKKFFFLGLGFYWTWVYLSFNSQQIVPVSLGGIPLISLLHIVSGLVGCLSFGLAIGKRKRIEGSLWRTTFLWAMAAFAVFGTLFYTLPLLDNPVQSVIVGALITGFATPWIALAWGSAYCILDARWSASLTAGSFLVAGILYVVIAEIPQPLSGVIVAFLPIVSVLFLAIGTFERSFKKGFSKPEDKEESLGKELTAMVSGAFSIRVMGGILLTLFVSGGLRVYTAHQTPSIYHDPFLVSLAILAVALVFLIYSLFIPRTGLSLGPLYRIALPLFVIAITALTVFSTPNPEISFLIVSAGSTCMDMLTWVLLIEIVRSSRFSALLVFAVGRLIIHVGMALGEATALFAPQGMTAFSIVSVVILVIVSGFMFSDRDKTLIFEPLHENELSFTEASFGLLDRRIESIAVSYGLTPRETEVFILWATGHGSKAIEEKLVLSSATVRTHVRHIYEKCEVHNRAEVLNLIEHAKNC